MSPKKIFLALPIDNGAKRAWERCIHALRDNAPCDMVEAEVYGDSLVSRARNTLSAQFLKTDCTHLLWIDSDIIFKPEDVARLASHDVGVVAGFYPKKQAELAWVCNALAEPAAVDPTTGLQPVRYMGTGFMLIAREVFERMRNEYPDIAFTPDGKEEETEWDFWQVGVYKFPDGFRRYLSEDWWFCQRCLDMGIQVHADTRIVVQHIGEVAYPLPDQRHKYEVRHE